MLAKKAPLTNIFIAITTVRGELFSVNISPETNENYLEQIAPLIYTLRKLWLTLLKNIK